MSVKKNYFYNLFYQIITIFFPLITIPYVSRVLGSHGVGVYAYTNSIVQYFVLFGMLGLGTYGSKSIAASRDTKKCLSETFLSIYGLQLMMTTLALVIYFLFIKFSIIGYTTIMYIQGIALLSCLLDCSWFFTGLEKFKQIVIRNTIVKVTSVLLLFLLVKTSNDLAMYTIIMTVSTLVGQIVLWFGIKEYICIVPIKFTQILKHFKPTLAYFIPLVAIQVYTVLNKTMIGIFSTETEVGVFDYSDKILKVSLTFITSLGTVMLPQVAYLSSNGELKKVRIYLFKSLDFSTFIAIPIMLGLAGSSIEFIPWYLGDDFHKAIYILMVICPTIFFISWGNVFGSQYLLPLGKVKQYTICVYIGAIVNLVFNLFLIRPYGAMGAAVSTLFAEFAVMVTQLIFMRSEIAFKKIFLKTIDYFIAGFLMFCVIRIIGFYLGSRIITTLLQVSVGGITYILIVIIIEYIKKDGLVLNELKRVISLIKR